MCEEDEDECDDADRWLWVDCEGSRPGYRDMEWFISAIEDAEIQDRLNSSISGRGAFRRFKDTLSRWPDLMTRCSPSPRIASAGAREPGSPMRATCQPREIESCLTRQTRSGQEGEWTESPTERAASSRRVVRHKGVGVNSERTKRGGGHPSYADECRGEVLPRGTASEVGPEATVGSRGLGERQPRVLGAHASSGSRDLRKQ
jgi:hypothetical protein